MMLRLSLLLCFALTFIYAQNPTTVRFTTNLGNIDVLLLPESAPRTVENFLKYMNKGAFSNSIFHRSVKNFIIQGGGFQAVLPGLPPIAQDAAVINEYKESNARGTLSMAKLGSDPNSATNQWFFNLNNNAAILNGQNGGFTVFGRVVDSASLAVMDKIAALPIFGPYSAPYDEMPLTGYSGGTVQQSNLVIVQTIGPIVTLPPPVISDAGIISAGAFGGYASAAPGSFLEIYGSNLAGEVSRSWTSDDFVNNVAPTSLEGVSVTVGGQRAFVNYVSPTQVNVQVPSTVSYANLPVVVTYKLQPSTPLYIDIKQLAGGLLAPASYKIGGKQFVYAVHAVGNAPVTATSPAKPGETLLYYGSGFGPMNPFSIPFAGQIVQTLGTLGYPTQWKIGGIPAQVLFQGLIPGLVGVYQFNVVVPPEAPSGDLTVEVTQNGATVPQSLFLPIQP